MTFLCVSVNSIIALPKHLSRFILIMCMTIASDWSFASFFQMLVVLVQFWKLTELDINILYLMYEFNE